MSTSMNELFKLGVKKQWIERYTVEQCDALFQRLYCWHNPRVIGKAHITLYQWQIDALVGEDIQALIDANRQSGDLFDRNIAHYVAWSGNLNNLKILVNNNVPFDIPRYSGETIAYYAALSGNPELLDYLQQQSPELLRKKMYRHKHTLAHYAVLSGKVGTLEWIHKNMPELVEETTDTVTAQGVNIAHFASAVGNEAALTFIKINYPHLLERKNNLDQSVYVYAQGTINNDKTVNWVAANSPAAIDNELRLLRNEKLSLFKSSAAGKIAALEALRAILYKSDDSPISYDELRAWYAQHGNAVKEKRNFFHAFFDRNHQSKTEQFVNRIFEHFQLDKTQFMNSDQIQRDVVEYTSSPKSGG